MVYVHCPVRCQCQGLYILDARHTAVGIEEADVPVFVAGDDHALDAGSRARRPCRNTLFRLVVPGPFSLRLGLHGFTRSRRLTRENKQHWKAETMTARMWRHFSLIGCTAEAWPGTHANSGRWTKISSTLRIRLQITYLFSYSCRYLLSV